MPEIVFRVITVLLFIVYVTIRKSWQRRLLAHLKQPPRIERGRVRERVALGAMALLQIPLFVWIFTSWLDAAAVPVPDWLRLVGAGVFALGLYYFAATHRALASNWTPLLEIRDGDSLVTTGPYRLVRHPMYSAALVIHVGLSILCANWAAALGLLLSFGAVYVFRVRDEERLMLDAFGDEYRAYMGRTGRLVPRLDALIGRRA